MTRTFVVYITAFVLVDLNYSMPFGCENRQCFGPKFYRSDCCEGYICASRSDSPMLMCVNQRERLRVLNFNEVLAVANNYAEKQARNERMNYGMHMGGTDDFQQKDAFGRFWNPEVQNTGRFQNQELFGNGEFQYGQPIRQPSHFSNNYLLDEPNIFPNAIPRQPNENEIFLSQGRGRGLPEGEGFLGFS